MFIDETLSFETFTQGLPSILSIQDESRKKLIDNQAFLVEALSKGTPIYGVTTGFGPLVHSTVKETDWLSLQTNLLQQLSASSGPEVSYESARLTLLLRIRTLVQAKSGVSPDLLEYLLAFYNEGLAPVLQEWGSVGASGDLVPLARLARCLLGQDYLWINHETKQKNSPELLERFGLSPYTLKVKEGLALVNGTSFSCALSIQTAQKTRGLLFNRILPLLATQWLIFNDSLQFLAPFIYESKPHSSAQEIAAEFRTLLSLPHPENSHGVPQPPYSTRSSVLWLGAALERLSQAESLLSVEMNSVDDNPLFDHVGGSILHASNFQGTYVALAADQLHQALTQGSLLVERSMNRILHTSLNGDLPAFLAPSPVGLHSGLQGLQLLSSSLVASLRISTQNHSLSSIPTNADNQDVVSMSANAALASYHALDKVETLLSAYTLVLLRALQLNPVSLPNRLHAFWENYSAFATLDFGSTSINYSELLKEVSQIKS